MGADFFRQDDMMLCLPAGRLRMRPFSKRASAKACNLSRTAIYDGILINQLAGWRRINTDVFCGILGLTRSRKLDMMSRRAGGGPGNSFVLSKS